MTNTQTVRSRRKYIVQCLAFALAILIFILPGCAGLPGAGSVPATSALLSTPIPPYVGTEQASALRARSTIQAGEAQAYNLALTGTAVAMDVNQQSTLVALQLAQSAATEQYFIRQTQISAETTATASLVYAVGTATASQAAIDGTATAQSQAATQAAATQQTIATGTSQAATATQAEADHRVQATATQLVINELIRRDESQRQTQLFRTWALRLALVLSFVFGLVLIWKATPWLLMRFFGFQSWNGKPIIVIPDKKGGFKIVDMARSLGPGLEFDQDGHLITTGSTSDIQIQNAITARAQAGELLLSMSHLPAETRKQVLRQAAQLATPLSPAPLLPTELANVQFKVLPADDHQVGAWLQDVEPKLLEGGE
ncbi:MAG: hypothetical protein ACKOC5_03285 [Chloroflexota bacterium]